MDITSEIHQISNQYLRKVKPSGPENLMAICPFHVKADGSQEATPSFAISTITGLWFCHSCQAKGNLYTFLRDMGLGAAEIAFRYQPLLDAAKRNLPPAPDPTRPGEVFSSNPLPEGLLGIFDYCPLQLVNDGFAEETLRHFDIGFDMQHMRITYPIRDLSGALVAISGRSVNGTWPRYKIYDTEYRLWDLPERRHWDKRTALWNAHSVYSSLFLTTAPSEIVVVEGFKACMWVWQAGIKNVVALLGTYLSWEHQWILERLGSTVCLFLDNNDPGQTGTAKCGERLKASTMVKVVTYPERLANDEKAQPDSCTKEEVLEQIQHAVSYSDWVWN